MRKTEDFKQIIAQNIIELRKSADLTQLDLAEKLNYTDKAISKWERGESIPDVSVLKSIADLFGVTVDYLLTAEHDGSETPQIAETDPHAKRNHLVIIGLSVLLVWMIASFAFVIIGIVAPEIHVHWLSFIYAVPVSCLVWLVLNAVWFRNKTVFLIISLLMWSALTSVFLSFLAYGYNFWLLYILGIPGQFIIITWTGIRIVPRSKKASADKKGKREKEEK